MSTLLNSSRVPLWAVIVIIAVGSILFVSFVVVILRCLYVRKRRRNSRSVVSPDAPTRKVTIRRGKVVPSSKHLSLTGSAFGALGDDVETADHGSTRTRSRSPFEWWATIRERSQSRQSEMTQTGSLNSALPEPESSSSDFASPSRRRYVDPPPPDSPTRTPLVPLPYSSSHLFSVQIRPSRNTNFSRNLSTDPHIQHTPSPRTQPLESLAEEEDYGDHIPAHLNDDPEKTTSLVTTEKMPDVPPPAARPPYPVPLSPSTYRQSFLSSTSTVSLNVASLARSRSTPSLPDQVRSHPNLPAPSHLRQMVRRSSSSVSESSGTYRQPEQPSRRSSLINEVPREEIRLSRSVENLRRSESEYWGSKSDPPPVRKPSKKGKVLRKKSLRRAEITTMVQ